MWKPVFETVYKSLFILLICVDDFGEILEKPFFVKIGFSKPFPKKLLASIAQNDN